MVQHVGEALAVDARASRWPVPRMSKYKAAPETGLRTARRVSHCFVKMCRPTRTLIVTDAAV